MVQVSKIKNQCCLVFVSVMSVYCIMSLHYVSGCFLHCVDSALYARVFSLLLVYCNIFQCDCICALAYISV